MGKMLSVHARSARLITLVILLVAMIAAGCSNGKANNNGKISENGSEAQSDPVQGENANKYATQIQGYHDIKAMFADDKDLADIKISYIDLYRASTQAIDGSTDPDAPKIDDSILFVLDNAIEGNLERGQAGQAVDKGLQWYFYFELKNLINKIATPALEQGDKTAASAALGDAVSLYKGVLEATAAKRDNKFGTTMAPLLDTVFDELRKDIERGDADEFKVHRQMIDKTLIKMFTLATLTYAESIPGKDPAEQPAAMTEGYFFYMPVYLYLKGGSADDADYIRDAFASGDPAKIDYAKISAAIRQTLIGKVNEYMEKTLAKLAEGDTLSARVYAMEGAMFLAAQETFLGDKYESAAEAVESLHAVVKEGKTVEAKMYTEQILQAIAQ